MDPDTVVDQERAFDNELSNGMRFDVPFDAVPPGLHETDEVIDQAFQTELRERNLPMLLWTAVVFNIA